jgi:hypothetical protein
MKTYGGVEVWGEWSPSRPDCFTSGTHWMGGWEGPRADLHTMDKRKISFFCRKTNAYSSAVQPIARRYTDWAIPAPSIRPVV